MRDNLSNYQFWSSYDAPKESTDNRGITRVVAYGPFGDQPVGAIEMKHAPARGGYHYLDDEVGTERTSVRSGQKFWSGGAFDARKPHEVSHVSFLGMSQTHQSPSLLKGLIGALHGQTHETPHADKDLSEAGARISRGMNRRMGLKPHPANPEMEPTFSTMGDPQGYIRYTESKAERVGGQGHREYDAIPDAHVAQDTRAVFAKPPWTRPERPTRDEQLRLF